jgi:site-specific DNA recombinase
VWSFPGVAKRSLIPYRGQRPGRERAWVNLDHAMRNAYSVSAELLGEGRRRATIRQSVLIAVPRAGHTAVDDAPLADWPILVGAKIGERPDLRAIAEDRNAFAVRRSDNARPLVRDRQRWPDCEPAVAAPSAGAVARPLAPAGYEMEQRRDGKAACQHCRDERIAVVLHDAERHVHHDEPVRGVKRPRGSTPEDELLVQFQGMIAEYERAQILERSRRGKRHRARQGEISVLSGAPFGYRFIRKTDHAAAYYQIDEEQARIVRWMFELYSVEGLSIGAIARLLNARAIPTCKRRGRWERSTVWGMLRNPAYKGQACFGKTTIAPRQRITRPIRLRGGIAPRNSASHDRPRADWITIVVPPIVSEETFALAQERLEANKIHAPRRTITPSVVQGLVSCAKCGYALYRTSTRSSARAIYYYRCLGSDAWRRLSGPVCNNRPVRQDLLDEVVWTEIVRLLEDPQLIQSELDRRLAAARDAAPSKRREEALRRDLVRLRKSIDRLLTAYQEGLLSLDELRERMPSLRRREQADNAEMQAILDQSVDRAACLRLAETLTTFLTRLRSSAGALDISERQRVLRLLVKEILVGDDKIIIRHSIPLPTGGDGQSAQSASDAPPTIADYLLRSRSHLAAAVEHLPASS